METEPADPAVAAGRVLEFDSLRLSRRHRLLLADLEAAVPAGATLAVMGRSGVGKTTLLRTIVGLAQPITGRVIRPPGPVPVVFQEPRLLPWRTALQNVQFVLPAARERRAIEWLARVGLSDSAYAYPMTLSGGMRQRVSIARALACEAPLLLVDEPFSHLDVVTAQQLRAELIGHLRRTSTAAVWVTHDPAEAALVADRTLVMAGLPHGAWRIVNHGHHATTDQTAIALAAALEQATEPAPT